MRRLKVGDLLEIPTAKGRWYAQVTHRHATYGTLLRVLPGPHEAPLSKADLGALAGAKEEFVAFVPADSGVSWGLFRHVGHAAVPDHARPFPLFKAGVPLPGQIRVDSWRLWDGENELPVGALNQQQLSLPIREIVSPRLLILHLESGWTPASDLTVTGAPSKEEREAASASAARTRGESHFLYFRTKSAAERARRRLADAQFDVEVKSRGEGNWLVFVAFPGARSVSELEETRQLLERVATEFGGEYDGWEALV